VKVKVFNIQFYLSVIF